MGPNQVQEGVRKGARGHFRRCDRRGSPQGTCRNLRFGLVAVFDLTTNLSPLKKSIRCWNLPTLVETDDLEWTIGPRESEHLQKNRQLDLVDTFAVFTVRYASKQC